MKYAFMSFSTPDLSLSQMLEVADRYGYDGIEPRLDASHAHGVEVLTGKLEREAIRNQCSSSGIPIVCLAASIRYADPNTSALAIQETHERIDLAGDVGAPRIRVFGGKIGAGLDRAAAVDLLVSCLGAVADHAAERGVTLCLETHDDWCNPADVASVLSRVNNPAVAANWDIMHPVKSAGVSMRDAYLTLAPWVKHVHFHDGTSEGLVPIGTGLIDHRLAIQLLAEAGYDGYLSGEWIKWEPYDVHLPRELAAMRAYERALGIE